LETKELQLDALAFKGMEFYRGEILKKILFQLIWAQEGDRRALQRTAIHKNMRCNREIIGRVSIFFTQGFDR